MGKAGKRKEMVEGQVEWESYVWEGCVREKVYTMLLYMYF